MVIKLTILEFMKIVGQAKRIPRTGWVKSGISPAESVADHMYRSAVLCMILGDLKGLDSDKMIRMALLDDLAETITGDLTPDEQMTLGDSRVREDNEAAIRKILGKLPTSLSDKYLKIWVESQEHRSSESILARELEKLEMIIQALEYEEQASGSKSLDEFWLNIRSQIKDPDIVKLLDSLEGERKRARSGMP
ncbi:MAG: HD domain-containing protein [Candidatus Bathyarchaeota archaeon]